MKKTPNQKTEAFHYTSVTSVQALPDKIDTTQIFDKSFQESSISPIDQFIDNTNQLNRIYLNAPQPLTRELGAIVFLGYMSAVESYIRAMIRGLINTDEYSSRLVEARLVSFGAALHHSRALLPEALMEDMSFAGSANILETLKGFIGIKGQIPSELKKPYELYNQACALRHCCVHRFGKLGTKNAIELGLGEHKELLEKPLLLSTADIEAIADILRTFVKSINNFVFRTLLDRIAKNKDDEGKQMYGASWTWDYRKDKKRFSRYYSLFSSTMDSPPSLNAVDVYNSLKHFYATEKQTGKQKKKNN